MQVAQQVPSPGRGRATPRRRQFRITKRQRGRLPGIPVDRRTPSGRLLPY
jgi:hypothetical protein